MSTCKYCPAKLTGRRRVCDECKRQRKREASAKYYYEKVRGKK